MSGGTWTLRVPEHIMGRLEQHLFPGDNDEHGAVIGAAVVSTERGYRLLARRLFLAEDGVDYVAGQRGYRMLTASFVRDCALACSDEGLAYLAVHCHRGTNRVALSPDDLASQERGYPALLDILDGPPVGGLVFAREAVAGQIWLPDGSRVPLAHLVVPGRPIRRLFPAPLPNPSDADERYDRQARLFGDRGQDLLARQKVAIIGAGGGGSLLVEYLARLGVGHLVVIDPDVIELTNLPRIVGACLEDIGRPKVEVAARVARQAQPGIIIEAICGDVTDEEVAATLTDCDYILLAADTMQARLLTNAVIHQYLVPGVQIGAKAQVDQATGDLLDLFSVVRPVIPGRGCLWCNGLISAAKLQEEATAPEQLARQRYIQEANVHAPSVITLNAVSAAHAANDYLMSVTGLLHANSVRWAKYYPREGEAAYDIPRSDSDCPECSSIGRLAAGDQIRLPTQSTR